MYIRSKTCAHQVQLCQSYSSHGSNSSQLAIGRKEERTMGFALTRMSGPHRSRSLIHRKCLESSAPIAAKITLIDMRVTTGSYITKQRGGGLPAAFHSCSWGHSKVLCVLRWLYSPCNPSNSGRARPISALYAYYLAPVGARMVARCLVGLE